MKNLASFVIFLLFVLLGCAPDYLDVKPNKALVVPNQLHHFQALLDAASVAMNQGPGIQLTATDEFYYPEENIQDLPSVERNSYMWAENIFEGQGAYDWEYPYKAIFNANIVLDGLAKIKPGPSSQQEWDHIYGSALFYRAFSLYNLAEVFAAPYDQATAAQLPGIPVRLSMDVNEIAGRGTLKQTYDRIISDLTEAEKLLAPKVSYINRPSGAAVKALLARIYLSMHRYDKAFEMSSAFLRIYDQLLDYNSLDTTTYVPFPEPFLRTNPEVIYYYLVTPYSLTSSPLTNVDTLIYRSYQPDDLRKSCFFVSRGNHVFSFRGSYSGESTLFSGLLTDEIYLIRAECYARSKMTAQALSDLNTLLKARFKKGSFVALQATDQTILDLVLTERRKELFARGLRWSDLRRLNKETEHAVTLTRIVKGSRHNLPPNHNRYVFPIPDDEISLSGIDQNPR